MALISPPMPLRVYREMPYVPIPTRVQMDRARSRTVPSAQFSDAVVSLMSPSAAR